MERSLTVLLPVQNAQATLADTVAEVLEVAADLSERFEVVIIDDGSRDATPEVGDELVRHYPQVRMVRHRTPLGRDAAVRTGVAQSRGQIIFVRHADRRTIEPLYRPSRPTRPNYLSRMKRFALGE